METRKMLKLQLHQAEVSRDQYLAGMKVLAEKAERLEEENEILKMESADLGPKYRKAMMANQALTAQWEKLQAEHEQLQKDYRLMEYAVNESGRIRKKQSIEKQMLMQELEKFGYSFERSQNGLICHRPEEGAEQNEA